MPSPAEAAIAIANSIPSGDPTVDAAKWVAFVLILIGVGTYPFMMFINKRTKDRNENQLDTAMSSAGSTLYTQLIKQVDEYRKIADKAYSDREALLARLSALELQVALHTNDANKVVDLTARLDAKNAELSVMLEKATQERASFLEVLTEKEAAINLRDGRILQLEQSVHALQLRLVRDEARQIFGAHTCPFAKAKAAGKKFPPEIDEILEGGYCTEQAGDAAALQPITIHPAE